jgi:hypothetical protein
VAIVSGAFVAAYIVGGILMNPDTYKPAPPAKQQQSQQANPTFSTGRKT